MRTGMEHDTNGEHLGEEGYQLLQEAVRAWLGMRCMAGSDPALGCSSEWRLPCVWRLVYGSLGTCSRSDALPRRRIIPEPPCRCSPMGLAGL